ncbi:HTH_Tnp_Tc3_2 domain-containing protein [Trichonephila clavipes]|nr:HTH_Tnp_Tc3_2 domain-containing protein [Trichonephila clavipes]
MFQLVLVFREVGWNIAPRVTTPNEDRYLAVTAKRNRRNTASYLSRQLSSATGTTFSRQSVYRRLGYIGLYARRPIRCVPLTATHFKKPGVESMLCGHHNSGLV